MQGTEEALDKRGSAGTLSSKLRLSMAVTKRSSEFYRIQLLFQGSTCLMAGKCTFYQLSLNSSISGSGDPSPFPWSDYLIQEAGLALRH